MTDPILIPESAIVASSSALGIMPDNARPNTAATWRSSPQDQKPSVTITVNQFKDIDLGSVRLPESDNVKAFTIAIQSADDNQPKPFNAEGVSSLVSTVRHNHIVTETV